MSGPEATEPWWADLGERLDGVVGVPGGAEPAAADPPAHLGPEEPPLPGLGFASGPGPDAVPAPVLPELPDAAWIAALLVLEGMGPARLANLLGAFGARAAWSRVLDGSLVSRRDLGGQLGTIHWPSLVGGWQRTARSIDVERYWRRHVRAGIGVTARESPAFPTCLVDDPEPPAVLFYAGDPEVIPGPKVAIIGTRRCSERGRRVADEMGFELSRAGVRVVSGLARGIDGSAHTGALRAADRGGAPPIGVVASGLDVVYPHDHGALWAAVAASGVLLSEVPLGVRPNRWRFPARNRVIAGLADVVVVVESPMTGGSMYTVDEALRRGVTVLAVPGAVGLRAGEGTNKLIFEGAGVARDAADVLMALGLGLATAGCPPPEMRPQPSEVGAAVLQAMAWQPAALSDLVARTGSPVADVAEAVAALCDAGWVAQTGAWIERVAR